MKIEKTFENYFGIPMPENISQVMITITIDNGDKQYTKFVHCEKDALPGPEMTIKQIESLFFRHEFEKDELVLVNNKGTWIKRYYSHKKNGAHYVFNNGCTSMTVWSDTDVSFYHECVPYFGNEHLAQ